MQDYQFSIDIHLLVGWEKNAPGFYERAKEREVWRGKEQGGQGSDRGFGAQSQQYPHPPRC